MRFAVISDIHGNCLALEAVLEDIRGQGVDATLNLGDMLSGPLEPRRTADLLFASDFPTVRGNHERSLLGEAPAGAVDGFARRDLLPAQIEWLAALPATLVIDGTVFMCHGTPRSDTAPWLDAWMEQRRFTLPDEAAVAAEADGFDYPVLLCGHTHVARAVRLSDGRLIVNPGSVGLQMNYGSPDARYAIIEQRKAAWSVAFRVIPYNHEAAARQAVANGFPRWRDVLRGGWSAAEGIVLAGFAEATPTAANAGQDDRIARRAGLPSGVQKLLNNRRRFNQLLTMRAGSSTEESSANVRLRSPESAARCRV